MFLSAVLSVAVLLLMPTAMGISLCGILKWKESSLAACYTLGMFATWAIFQLIALPLILLKTSFTLLMLFVSVIYLLVILYGILRYRYVPKRNGRIFENKYDILLFSLMILVFIYVLYLQTRYTMIDDDDSFFVVNAVDTLRTNTMFRYNADTGYLLDESAKLSRYAISPWVTYQAYLSKLTLLHPTILIHLIHPIALFLVAFEIQWRLSNQFVGEATRYRSLYCILFWLVMLYIGYNGWTAEGFLMQRVWQGKATVAGVGVPCLFSLLLEGYERDIKELFPILILINLGLCLPSNMGMLLGGFMTGVYGIVWAIKKKSLKAAVLIWITAIPNAVYAALIKILT